MNRRKGAEHVLVVTMGDPGGIGPEVLIKALCHWRPPPSLKVLVFGDRDWLSAVAASLNLPGPQKWERVEIVDPCQGRFSSYEWGALSDAGAEAQVRYIEAALSTLAQGDADGLVTGPIHKGAFVKMGLPYHGHTEWLAEATQRSAVMMLAGPRLRTVPVTVHIPLRDVAEALTPALLWETLTITHRAMGDWFGLEQPRIAVCGLNPHASDDGMMGDEEARIIEPVLARARSEGIDVSGPLPGDTAFYFAAHQNAYDVVLAMYHDQALAPLKLLHFDEAVNLSMGLPFPRTSVDHGVAYDIAGQGVAKALSMIEALRLAAGFLARRKS